jgi:hypothetical protein
MHRVLLLLFLLASSRFISASDLYPRTATEIYHQRLADIINELPVLEREKLPAYGSASVHFSFRIDAAGRVSRLRVFAERPSDRPTAQIAARAIRAVRLPPPPRQVIAEQGHPWYDFPELVFLPGAD